MSAERILILGGTKEAAALAATLVAKGHHVTSSLAGRTREPTPLAGETRVGGFGGATGLAKWLQDHNITRLVDATHPFAQQISKNALEAARITGIPLESHQRAPWAKEPGDIWQTVADSSCAVSAIPQGARVLLALGSQHIAAFAKRNDVHFVVRMVDQPATALPFAQSTLVLGKPSPNWPDEAQLLKHHHITHIVCRNSGGDGAYAKIRAARRLEIPVIMIARA